jgi:hypothetical protein
MRIVQHDRADRDRFAHLVLRGTVLDKVVEIGTVHLFGESRNPVRSATNVRSA